MFRRATRSLEPVPEAPAPSEGAPAVTEASPGRPAMRALLLLVDVAILVGVFAASSWYRLASLNRAAVLVDQFSHLRGAHEILFDQHILQKPYFYTSAYLILMSGYQAIFSTPRMALTAWTLTGALTAPLGALAARRLAGPLAAIAVGLVLAFHPTDAAVVVGIKSPYFLSIFPALGMVGMAEALRRKACGPALMAFGLAAAVTMHLTLWPLGLLGVLMALALAVWQGRPRLLRLAGTLTPTIALTVWIALWDARRLQREVRRIMVEGFPPMGHHRDDLLGTALTGLGLGLEPAELPWRAPLAAAGLLGLGCVAVLLARRSERGRRWTNAAQARAIVGGLMALVLTLAGGAYFMWQVKKSGYLELHHLVGFGPLMAIALAGLGAGLLPARPAWLPWLGAGLAVLPWAVQHVRAVDGPVEPVQGRIETRLLNLADLARPIREQAVREGRWPVVFTWLPGDPPESGDVVTQVLGEFARWGYDPRGKRPTCWVVGAAPDLPASATFEVGGLAAVHDADCQALAGWANLLCDGSSRNLLRHRRPEPGGDPVTALMPCKSSR